jgi:CHAD domain-containing protein
MSVPPQPEEPGDDRRAQDFLAPALFAMIAAARRTAERVTAAGASGRDDPEAIHDFRVALRRLRTALRPAKRLWGKRHVKEIGAELRRFAQATGALRDEEVLRETLSELALPARARTELDGWIARRARQERERRRSVVRLLRAQDAPGSAPSLSLALAHLERRLGVRRLEELSAGELAHAALGGALEGVRALRDADPRDPAAMHALRITFKRLRYTAELFAPLLGEGAAATAKFAARMQKRLGELHDLDEALARVARARGLSPAARSAVHRALVQVRAEKRERIRRDLAEERLRLHPEHPEHPEQDAAPGATCFQGPPRP